MSVLPRNKIHLGCPRIVILIGRAVLGLIDWTPIRMLYFLNASNQNSSFLKMQHSDWCRIEKSEHWLEEWMKKRTVMLENYRIKILHRWYLLHFNNWRTPLWFLTCNDYYLSWKLGQIWKSKIIRNLQKEILKGNSLNLMILSICRERHYVTIINNNSSFLRVIWQSIVKIV